VRDDWVAARRLSSAFHSGSADNFLSAVLEIDTTERWQAVALALIGDVSTLADQAHGDCPGLARSPLGRAPRPWRPIRMTCAPRNRYQCNMTHYHQRS
jgi:hypothetical protein